MLRVARSCGGAVASVRGGGGCSSPRVLSSSSASGGGGTASRRAGAVPFSLLTRALAATERAGPRTEKIARLVAAFRYIAAVEPRALAPAAFLATGRTAPCFSAGGGGGSGSGGSSSAAGIGAATALKAAAAATGRPVAELAAAVEEAGDVAVAVGRAVAAAAAAGGTGGGGGPPLSIVDAYGVLRALVAAPGSGAKQELLAAGLARCGGGGAAEAEAQATFLLRAATGAALRTGLAEKSVVVALAHALCGGGGTGGNGQPLPDAPAVAPAEMAAAAPDVSKKGLAALLSAPPATVAGVEAAFARHPDLAVLIGAMHGAGVAGAVAACSLRPGVPALAMLGNAAVDVSDVSGRRAHICLCVCVRVCLRLCVYLSA